MMKTGLLAVVMLFSMVLLPIVVGQTSVNHVHFVDRDSSLPQFLFRGGEMDIDGNTCGFDYNALVAAIAVAAQQANIQLPHDYYLIDINLLNLIDGNWTCDDSRHSLTEFQFFDQNPHLGEFVFWQTYGDKDNASTPYFTQPFLKYLAKTLDQWQGDNVVGRTALYKMLHTPHHSGKPIVIYGHCDCGCDRTGEIFGSYYMRYMGYSWEKANIMNQVIAERPMGCDPWRAMQWFCLWLNEVQGFKLNCMKYEPCTVQD